MDDLRALYQQVILDHSRNPRFFGEQKAAQITKACVNPLCGDEITIYCNVDADKNILNLYFTGKGCAISIASASIMVAMMQSKSKAFFEQSLNTMYRLLEREASGPQLDDPAALAKLEVIAGVKQYPSRVKCATCAWHTLSAVMNDKAGVVKTE